MSIKLYFILVSDKILYTKTFTVGIVCFMTEHFVLIRKLVCHKKASEILFEADGGLMFCLIKASNVGKATVPVLEVPCVQTFYPILICESLKSANLCWQFSSLHFLIGWFSTLLTVLLTFSCSSYRLYSINHTAKK